MSTPQQRLLDGPASPWVYGRRPTRAVAVGRVGIGGDNPLRVQSMTTTITGDTEATALQTLALAEAGCEIVRVTVPNIPDARSLEPLRQRLAQLGVDVPLVADIHFNPHAAMIAADFVEKVRVNPGNYADTKRFAVREYSDDEYSAEIDRIREKFAPLVEKCKRLGIAMRVGTNHGSLSDRIMNRHGDTPLGMVESALEFVRLCEEQDYRALVLSMKSSNPFVAIRAYRLLASRMADEGMDYPFHLGVTEAGDGEDGRIKSAIGIGALLEEGIGDTVRVSLTEDPCNEVPVAMALVEPFNDGTRAKQAPAREWAPPTAASLRDYARRETDVVAIGGVSIGGDRPVAVVLDLDAADRGGSTSRADVVREHVGPAPGKDALADLAYMRILGPRDPAALESLRGALWRPEGRVAIALGVPATHVQHVIDAARGSVAAVFVEPDFEGAARFGSAIAQAPGGGALDEEAAVAEFWTGALAEAVGALRAAGLAVGVRVDDRDLAPAHASLSGPEAIARSAADVVEIATRAAGGPVLLSLVTGPSLSPAPAVRRVVELLDERGLGRTPVLLVDRSGADPTSTPLLEGSLRLGGLLADGIGDAVLVEAPADEAIGRAFGVLQTTRLRMSRPDYISCPSCGRTLFDLEEVTGRIKSVTSHLKGVKIAIMGCIVNGPGEMADADFGYVGSSPGNINLYVGKECVEKNVPSADAERRLVELIKAHGRWVEPVGATTG